MRQLLFRGAQAAGTLGLAIFAFGAIGAGELMAQTPEGTVIQNTATVTFTDANGNPYTPVDGVVSITVGFAAGVDVTRTDAVVTPAAGSTDNVISFTLTNIGNGLDTLQAAASITGDAGVITNVRYRIGATVYTTLANLNTALNSTELASNADVFVEVLYDVPTGTAGLTANFELTATSKRDPTKSDFDSTDVSPPLTGAIEVTTAVTSIIRLPSNGVQYSVVFTVDNQQSGSDTFDLLASVPGTVLSLVSVNGDAGASSTVTIAAGTTANITVVYTVADVAAGSTETLTFTATSLANGTVTDFATHQVTVVRPSLSITKQAYRSDQTTLIGPTDRVTPGEIVWYRITVENVGTANAVSVEVVDVLPAQLTYTGNAGDGGTPAWSISEIGGTVTATLPDPLPTGAPRNFWISVTVN